MAASQRFLCDAATSGESWENAVARLAESVGQPGSPVEELVLRSIMALLTLVVTRDYGRPRAADELARHLADILINPTFPLLEAFAAWVRRLRSKPGMPKSADPSRLVASRSFDESIDLKALGEDVGCPEPQLRAAFERVYGIPPRAFKQRMKALSAIGRLRQESLKNIAIAADMGYRSSKNFYRLVRLETGMTPKEVRQLSDGELAALRARLRPRLTKAGAQARLITKPAKGTKRTK